MPQQPTTGRPHRHVARRRVGLGAAVVTTLLLGLTSPAAAKGPKDDDKKHATSCSVSGGYSGKDTVGSLYNVIDEIKGDKAWKKGHTGEGIDVALIDTGVVPVPGLDGADKIVHGPDFSVESAHDEVRHLDTYGHGTHLAGIIAGNDVDAATEKLDEDEFQGVAPDARIVSVKVADHTGAVDVSQVIAAIDWVVANRNTNGLNIRVLNLSYRVNSGHGYEDDPLSLAVQNAWDNGIVVVVAAGNDGEETTSLPSPAKDPFVVTVSALSEKDQDKTNCLKGKPKWETTSWASGADKHNRQPDVYVPGTTIVSLRNPGSMIDTAFPSSVIDERFTKATGTSQSAAVVSGAVAVLLDARPELTPDEVKAILLDTAKGKEALVDLDKAVKEKTPKKAEQEHRRSNGRGSLEVARGGQHLLVDGQPMVGETTLFGPWSPETWVDASAAGAAWTGSSWTGSSWTGSSWTGSSWTGSSWTGSSWTGSSWTGSSWTGSSWTGSSWTGSTWTGSTWTGSSWASAFWQ
ncbi:MAG: S8 family serine peptidase [Actinomycetota bacterium]